MEIVDNVDKLGKKLCKSEKNPENKPLHKISKKRKNKNIHSCLMKVNHIKTVDIVDN